MRHHQLNLPNRPMRARIYGGVGAAGSRGLPLSRLGVRIAMTYILAGERDPDPKGSFDRYWEYLQVNQARFPQGAFALANSSWYFDAQNHRCPHDSWLEWVKVSESASGSSNENREISITIRLLGAYQDGWIEFQYPKVISYRLDISNGAAGHQDWRYDEFRLGDDGSLFHEIEWAGTGNNGRWLFQATDVEFNWIPK